MIKKLLLWLPRNLSAIIGIIQVVIKAIKEILTLAADALFLPQATIEKIRKIVNAIDGVLQKVRDFLLRVGG